MREPVRCTVLRSTGELVQLRAAWTHLWQRDPGTTPFQHPGWLLPWWLQFGDGPLRTAALYRGDSLVGLLPFYLYTEPADGCRKLLPLGISTSDYLDGVFAPECTTEDIVDALEQIAAAGEFDIFEVTQLRPASRLGQALELWAKTDFQPDAGDSTQQRAAVLYSDLPAKIRRNSRYYQVRAEQSGTVEFIIPPPERALEAYNCLERFHSARWRERGESGVLADPRVRACHREAVPQLAAEGIARFYCMTLNGQPVAVLYTLLDPPGRERRTLYSYLTAFSPEHAQLCPGTLVLAHAIDQAAQDGVTTFDFLRGNEPYKALWHTQQIPTHRFARDTRSART